MATQGPGWRLVDKGYNALRAEVLKLRERGAVVVGVFGDAAGERNSDEVTNLQVATWMEFGTRNGVPARSFLRATVAENGGRYVELIKRLLQGVLQGKYHSSKALALLGERVVSDVRRRIQRGIPPPLAESTIARKRSSKPLIDTGQFINAIGYEVRRSDGSAK